MRALRVRRHGLCYCCIKCSASALWVRHRQDQYVLHHETRKEPQQELPLHGYIRIIVVCPTRTYSQGCALKAYFLLRRKSECSKHLLRYAGGKTAIRTPNESSDGVSTLNLARTEALSPELTYQLF